MKRISSHRHELMADPADVVQAYVTETFNVLNTGPVGLMTYVRSAIGSFVVSGETHYRREGSLQ